jgi:Protein of unknown function (DUF3987)
MSLLSRLQQQPQPATQIPQAAAPAHVVEKYVPNAKLREDDNVAVEAFPLQIFPERIQQVVRDCERYMSFPPDITAAGILAAVSLSIARTHQVYYQGEWRETACIYMAIVAPPGSAKSHPLKFALHPIIERNKKAIKDYAKAQDLLAQAGAPISEDMKDRQCLYSDFTIEALAKAIQKNPRGISVYMDELRAWFQNFNRYNSGSEQEFWLENWSGGSMSISRMNRKAWLHRPSISVVGTIQPGMLEDIGKGGRSQNGFSERMLFVYPDNVPVLKVRRRNERSDTAAIMLRQYAPVLQTLLDMSLAIEGNQDEEDLAHEIVFELSADDYMTDYINALKSQMENIDNEYLRNVYSKMQTYSLRFCLIINRLEFACAYSSSDNRDFPPHDTYTVTYDQAQKAAILTEYFLKHALKANNVINAQTPLAKLPRDQRNFYKELPMGVVFSTTEAELAAVKHRISRATLFRLLNDTDPSRKLFQKVRHGEYERLYA